MRVNAGSVRLRSVAKTNVSYMECPSTKGQVVKPCGQTACAFNTTRPGSMVSAPSACLLEFIDSQAASDAERGSIAFRAKAVTSGKDVSSLAVSKAVAMLGSAYQDFQYAIGVPSGNMSCCQECGYPSPCAGRNICGERKTAAIGVLDGMLGGVLTPSQLWMSVVKGRASFLIPSTRKALERFVSSGSAKHA